MGFPSLYKDLTERKALKEEQWQENKSPNKEKHTITSRIVLSYILIYMEPNKGVFQGSPIESSKLGGTPKSM